MMNAYIDSKDDKFDQAKAVFEYSFADTKDTIEVGMKSKKYRDIEHWKAKLTIQASLSIQEAHAVSNLEAIEIKNIYLFRANHIGVWL